MADRDQMELGRRIKQSIKKSGITQGEIAVKLNISQNALSNYSNGKRIPDAIIIGKLARLCEVDPVWLLLGEEFKIPIARIPAPPSPLHEEAESYRDKDYEKLIVEHIYFKRMISDLQKQVLALQEKIDGLAKPRE